MVILLIALCLVACVGLASLAEAIRGLDPETLALPDELEEGGSPAPIAQVTGRFMAAEAHLRVAAFLFLGGAAFAAGRLVPDAAARAGATPSAVPPAWETLVAVAGAGLAGVAAGLLIPESLVHGREAAVLGRTTRLVLLLSAVFRPVTAVQRWLAAALAAVLGSPGPPPDDREPPRATVGPASGALEKVLSFVSSTVAEVMTPRLEMVVIESGARVERVARLVSTARRGRYPIYRGTLDEVIGAVDIRDLLRAGDQTDSIDAFRRGLPVVPESKRCWDLAFEIQSGADPMALVIDEFGAVSGLVTHADLLAELVGEIAEEGEPTPSEYQRVGSHSWVMTPFLRIDRVNELTGLVIPDGDYQTLAGFILSQLGRIPRPRERLHWGEGEIEILAASRRRIELVRVRMRRGRRRPPGRAGGGA